LTVSFLDNPPADLRARILSHMNAWAKSANVLFSESSTQGQVRIARTEGDGYWSYVGTDILSIGLDQPTMNLEAFTMNTDDSEFYRVVRHETGHTLGCPHEHMRQELVDKIDPAKAIEFFGRTQGWTEQEVREQVLTPIEESSLIGTSHDDPNSIMCYQIPGDVTWDGEPIVGGLDIDDVDFQFMSKIYPRSAGTDAPAAWGASPVDAAMVSGQKAQILSLGGEATWTVPIEVTVRIGRTAANGGAQTAEVVSEAPPDSSGDLDPGSPKQGEFDETGDFSAARDLANFGGPAARAAQARDLGPPAFGTPARLSIDINEALAFLRACETSSPRVTYGLGAKVPHFRAIPGREFTKVDCSGFVREAIREATSPSVAFPDGSVVQHDWVRHQGFQRTAVNAASQEDNVVRIAFLDPNDSPERIGHVVLVYNGRTLESHGGQGPVRGPDSRPWTGTDWQAKTSVYILK
jgi:hypothetical protein